MVNPSHATSFCQDVSICLNPSSQDIPSASESDCSADNMRYICQFKIPNFTTSDSALSTAARPTQSMIKIASDNLLTLPPEISESANCNFSTLSFTENSEVDKALLVGLPISVALQ